MISLVADLQDPPEMIWRYDSGVGKRHRWYWVKRTSEENPLMFWVRKKYYRVNRLFESRPSRTSPASACMTGVWWR